MNKFYGWAGAILRVDLTAGKVEKEELSPEFAKSFLGGSGFNAATLFDSVKKGVDALSSENILMFSAGPLVGTIAPSCSRLAVTAKSPLTDIFGDSSMGGHFSAELKHAGYDQIVCHGKSNKPVYLYVDDDVVELRDASHLWGKSTLETAWLIRQELGDPEIRVASIGQAGENLVRYAGVLDFKHAAGRCGMGAVMGSKNLKALAVRGTKDIFIAKPQEFYQACREAYETIRERVEAGRNLQPMLPSYGTAHLAKEIPPSGSIFTRNFKGQVWLDVEDVGPEKLKKEYSPTQRACFSCPMHCTPFYVVPTGKYAGIYGEGPEWGLIQIGPRCDFYDFPTYLYLNNLLNEYGIDPLSLQQMLAWTMDCYEKGILTEKDLDGTSFRWGDADAVIEMVHKIAKREGFGNILAEGERRAPQIVGRGSEKYMYHIKGMAPVIEDPRVGLFGFGYFTSTRGADHLKQFPATHDELIGRDIAQSDMGPKVKSNEDKNAVVDSVGMCKFVRGDIDEDDPYRSIAKLMSAATGVDFSVKDLLEIGERIYNIEKAFNSREGLTRKDDSYSVPEMIFEPIPEGPSKGVVQQLEPKLNDYYKARGWDRETGLQTRSKLEQLKLKYVADELEKYNAVK